MRRKREISENEPVLSCFMALPSYSLGDEVNH
jgi:hypothetical protein